MARRRPPPEPRSLLVPSPRVRTKRRGAGGSPAPRLGPRCCSGCGRRGVNLPAQLRQRDVAERTTEGEDEEADPGEQKRNAHHDREDRDPLREERRVERGRQRGLRHPEVAEAVLDGTPIRRLRRRRLIARLLATRSQEPTHLRVMLTLRRLERMELHHVGERPRVGARLDRLTRLEPAIGDLGSIIRRGDLLRRDLVTDLVEAVGADRDRAGTERHENHTRRDPSISEPLLHHLLLSVGRTLRSGSATRPPAPSAPTPNVLRWTTEPVRGEIGRTARAEQSRPLQQLLELELSTGRSRRIGRRASRRASGASAWHRSGPSAPDRLRVLARMRAADPEAAAGTSSSAGPRDAGTAPSRPA